MTGDPWGWFAAAVTAALITAATLTGPTPAPAADHTSTPTPRCCVVGGHRVGDPIRTTFGAHRVALTAETATVILDHFPARWHRWAVEIVACESEFRPGARNPRSSASGLFQMTKRWAHLIPGGWGNRFDARANAVAAAALLERGGPQHWECHRRIDAR